VLRGDELTVGACGCVPACPADTTMSPDQRLLVYASISPVAFVVNVGSSYDVVSRQGAEH
jgi:hypothetical protein